MPRGEVILLLPQESPAGGCAGRPLGDEAFLERLKGLVGRVLKPQKGGRPRNQENQEWVTRFCLRDFVKSGAVFSLDYRVDAEGMTPSVGTITTKFPEKPEDFLIEEE